LFFQESGKICLMEVGVVPVLSRAAMRIRVEGAVQGVAAPIIAAIHLVRGLYRRNINLDNRVEP
jgi:hypothetical protein